MSTNGSKLLKLGLSAWLTLGVMGMAQAAPPPTYSVENVLIAPYMLDVPFAAEAPTGFNVTPISAPVYKPHEAVVDRTRDIWISANERGEHGNTNRYNPDATRVGEFRAGISVFNIADNAVLATLIIDEPQFAPHAPGYPANGILGPVSNPYTSSTGWLYHGMDMLGTRGAATSSAAGEDTGEQECPTYPPGSANAFVQTVLMPVVLPPNSKWDPARFSKKAQLDKFGRTDPSGKVLRVAGRDPRYGNDILVGYDAYNRAAIMMPMGSECHPRHPHGIAMDRVRGLVYLLIEHMGLEWNATRTDFDISLTTDRESGGGLVFDISDVAKPKIVTGYLSGHGAHEIEVSQQNGFVFMPNHEESPSVTDAPDIFQIVVNPAKGTYGFIDTGYFQALQDLMIDDEPGQDNTVYMVSHVGQRMYAIDGNCTPTKNANPTLATDPNPPHKVYVEKASGENCIKYWVDIRSPWNSFYGPVASQIFNTIDIGMPPNCLRSVLHFHNLALDPVNKKVYNGLHSIHHAEHTGLPWEDLTCPEIEENPVTGEEPEAHYNGRDVVVVDVNSAHMTIDSTTKQATTPTAVIEMSNGFGYLQYPNVEDVIGFPTNLADSIAAMNRLENSFVHPHWLGVDPGRNALLVTGEHTGNLGVVDIDSGKVTQVLPVSVMNSLLRTSSSSDCEVGADGVPDDLEPHMHGLQIDPLTGNLYLSDEGEHCFYGGEFIVTPRH